MCGKRGIKRDIPIQLLLGDARFTTWNGTAPTDNYRKEVGERKFPDFLMGIVWSCRLDSYVSKDWYEWTSWKAFYKQHPGHWFPTQFVLRRNGIDLRFILSSTSLWQNWDGCPTSPAIGLLFWLMEVLVQRNVILKGSYGDNWDSTIKALLKKLRIKLLGFMAIVRLGKYFG